VVKSWKKNGEKFSEETRLLLQHQKRGLNEHGQLERDQHPAPSAAAEALPKGRRPKAHSKKRLEKCHDRTSVQCGGVLRCALHPAPYSTFAVGCIVAVTVALHLFPTALTSFFTFYI
jgi:hypothetical protein